MGSSDFVTIFFLVAAVLIFLQLRSVLGRRTGNEKPPFEADARREAARPDADDKIVTLPRRDADPSERFAAIDAYAKPGTELNTSLRDLQNADAGFDVKAFLGGARQAYEMIVMAFADGDRKALKGLLSPEVFDSFDGAISEREQRGEVVKSTFVGIDKLDIIHAERTGNQVQLTLRIVSQLISATYDKAGTVVDGDAETVAEVNDLWTFARDIRDRDPNWKLVATESEQ